MKSDEDGFRGSGSGGGGGTGSSAILEREEGKGGADMIEKRELKAVRLVCLFCREVRLIHVPVHCETPKELLWECLACQERWAVRK